MILIMEKSTSELKESGLKEKKLDEGLTSKLTHYVTDRL